MAGPTFLPCQNAEDLVEAQNFICKRSDAQLIQISEYPTVLLTLMTRFTHANLDTADQRVIVGLAKNEMERRSGRKTRRIAWAAFAVSALSFALALVTFVMHLAAE